MQSTTELNTCPTLVVALILSAIYTQVSPLLYGVCVWVVPRLFQQSVFLHHYITPALLTYNNSL